MTNTTTTALPAPIMAIALELSQARDDIALLERLNAAAAREKRLSAKLAKAMAAHEAAEAAKAKAEAEARFYGLSDIRVIDTTPEEGVLQSAYAITYTRMAYDMDARQNLPQTVSITGFGGLSRSVLSFLIEKHPEQIPAKIMALDPADAENAFDRYFAGLRRGYLIG